ncbi:MAG: oligosaccharide flippase family protein [Deltaproteobacteria bacterium]|jgi:O-antigen/teichoic acid export membrane protein
MSYFKVIMKNVVSNWANMATSLVISFSLAPFILHKIGNTYYGVWAVASQVTGYLWLMDFGVRDSVVKYVAEYHEKKDDGMLNDIINASLKLYSIVCCACLVLTFILAFFFPMIFSGLRGTASTAQLLVIITGIDIALTFVFNVFIGILMGLQRFDVFSKISIALTIARALLTVFFLSKGYGVVAICLIQFLANCCMNIMVYAVSRRLLCYRLNFRRYGRGRDIYKLLLNYSFFVFLNCIALQVFSFSSNFIIAIFLPVSSVTFFAIAASLIEYMRKIIWAGTQAFSPLTSQLDAKNDASRVILLLVKGSKFSLLLGLPVGTVYLIMGKQFIGLWMGFEYATITGNILAVLTVMTLFSLPHYTISGILLGLNKHHLMAYCRVVEAIANICLSLLLIRHMGLLGAALGVAIPHLIMVIFVLPVLVSRALNIKLFYYFRFSYCGPLISIIPFALACLLAHHFFTPRSLITFFAEILLLLPAYIAAAWFFAISKEERQHCKEMIFALAPAALGR